jgi:hypothetical protein
LRKKKEKKAKLLYKPPDTSIPQVALSLSLSLFSFVLSLSLSLSLSSRAALCVLSVDRINEVQV